MWTPLMQGEILLHFRALCCSLAMVFLAYESIRLEKKLEKKP